VEDAAPQVSRVTVVSTAVEQSVRDATGGLFRTSMLPNVVDESVFFPRTLDERRELDRILFVGAVRWVKGLDVLVRAVSILREEWPEIRLSVLGEAFYGQWRRDEVEVRKLCVALGVGDCVEFSGPATGPEVARAMRRSAMLVVPGRRESFSAVAIESLASGTPVVATRCGGPEDFISDRTGRLVQPNDPEALAGAILDVRRRQAEFDPNELRRFCVERYGREATRLRLKDLYEAVLREVRP
jgi:glycosyltransferase involved in cell wall biosynthesis